jgi:photosystem II stability/assembly factor-like uncharacterized protein
MLAPKRHLHKAVLFFSVTLILSLGFLCIPLPGSSGSHALADPGLGWEVQPPPPVSGVWTSDISAVNKDVAWAVGEGYLLKTVDGGAHWNIVYQSASTHLLDICAVTENILWTVGYEVNGSTSTSFIYRSENGGGSWTLQYYYTGAGVFNAISAVDANTAWVVGAGGIILKTTNGGGNWTLQPYGYTNTLSSVCAIDVNTAWVSGSSIPFYGTWDHMLPDYSASPPSYPIVLKTTDGGATWVAKQMGTYNEYFFDIAAVDGNNAIAVGKDIAYSPLPGWWAPFDYPQLGYFALVSIGQWNIMVTHDGGNSWSAGSGGSADRAVDMVDANIGWAVGFDYTIQKTADGGNTWLTQYSRPGTHWYLTDVDAVDVNNAWAVGDGATILHTATGGSVKPTVTSITPNTANQYTVSLQITDLAGTNFQPGASVRLEKGAAVINAYNVSVVSGNKITCTIGFFGAEPGAYDVVVVSPGGGEARLPGAFTVTSMCGQGSGAALLALGLTLGLLSLAGTAGLRRKGRKR